MWRALWILAPNGSDEGDRRATLWAVVLEVEEADEALVIEGGTDLTSCLYQARKRRERQAQGMHGGNSRSAHGLVL